MKNFNQLADLYFKKKRRILQKSTNIVLFKSEYIKDFDYMLKSIFYVFQNLNQVKNEIKNNKIGYINTFYDVYDSEYLIKNKPITEMVLKASYYDDLCAFLKSLKPEFSRLINYYLKRTKEQYNSEDLNLIVFFILMVENSINFQNIKQNLFT